CRKIPCFAEIIVVVSSVQVTVRRGYESVDRRRRPAQYDAMEQHLPVETGKWVIRAFTDLVVVHQIVLQQQAGIGGLQRPFVCAHTQECTGEQRVSSRLGGPGWVILLFGQEM